MASVCFYFQVHQPFRLRRYSVFDSEPHYFDDETNRRILNKVADKCYRPATRKIIELVERHGDQFRMAFSLTGSVIEQWQRDAPDLIELFQQLSDSGCCEFLAETYHHSLAFLYSRDEFNEQVDLHTQMIESLFGQTPRVFRNTELIYNNELAAHVASLKRFTGIIAEGADHILGHRSPNQVYHPHAPNHGGGLSLLLKNYRLSDDIAFRFSNQNWNEWPLTVDKFTQWVNRINSDGDQHGVACNLFLDYETFGEHQWESTGIFDFLDQLPAAILNSKHNDFATPSEIIERYKPVDDFNAPHMISWADTERDLSAWLGNAMQSNALQELYKLEPRVKSIAASKHTDATNILRDWRYLTTSDHFYYMCTKYFADGDVHKYFNPYESPYDSYINFMNVLDNLRTRIETATS